MISATRCASARTSATLTNYILVLVTAGTGLIVQQRFADRTIALALLIAGLGAYGAIAVAKYHERAEYHLTQARALTKTLVDLGALPSDRGVRDQRKAHHQKYPHLAKLRLHWLWTGLHAAISVYGIALIIWLALK